MLFDPIRFDNSLKMPAPNRSLKARVSVLAMSVLAGLRGVRVNRRVWNFLSAARRGGVNAAPQSHRGLRWKSRRRLRRARLAMARWMARRKKSPVRDPKPLLPQKRSARLLALEPRIVFDAAAIATAADVADQTAEQVEAAQADTTDHGGIPDLPQFEICAVGMGNEDRQEIAFIDFLRGQCRPADRRHRPGR